MHCQEGLAQSILITVEPHAGIRGRCSRCQRPAPGYDQLTHRRSWLFVPLWGLVTWFVPYAARRVDCPEHGVGVEHVPWSQGKRPVSMRDDGFSVSLGAPTLLARDGAGFRHQLGSRLPFGGMVRGWGLARREFVNVESIGVDEIHWGHGANGRTSS